MKTVLISGVLILGVSAFAGSNVHKVDIQQDSVIEGKTVRAGEYKISLENGNAFLKMGKDVIEVPAREVSESDKVSSDEFIYTDNNKLESIRIAGTSMRIVFEPAAPTMQSGS